MSSEVQAVAIESSAPVERAPALVAVPAPVPAQPGLALRARAKRSLQTLFGYGYDLARFARHSTAMRPETDLESLDAHITMDFHRVEKGLALPQPKPGFGEDVIRRLMRNVSYSEARFGGTPATRSARSALAQYQEHARASGRELPELTSFLSHQPYSPACGGTLPLTRSEVHAKAKRDLDDFFFSRFSVRQFTGDAVAEDQIWKAVQLAAKTPSVCNRQSARVHAFVQPEEIQKALAIQGGNRGFGHLVGALMVVTTDLRKFVSSAERYQGWIDGGLFAMSLCYAFHSLGLGTCMLNWSVNPRIDLRLRAAVTLPPAENVIVMMAVGHLPERFSVAMSPRLSLESLLTVHR
jgi:nitroreductase